MENISDNIFLEVYKSIDKDLELPKTEEFSEDELIRIISARVEYLLEHDKDLMMSFLYRLDIPNEKVQAALRITHEIPVHVSLGLLIYYRQLERVRTKLKYKQPDLGEEWNTWH